MIKILITDDNLNKIANISKLIATIPEIKGYDVAHNVISAKKFLSQNHYDLLILDLSLPNREGEDPNAENGNDFLQDISRISRLIKPYHIVGLSEYDEYINAFQDSFDQELWALLKYDPSSTGWEKLLKKKINYLIDSKRSLLQNIDSFQYDVAIVTALREPELEAVLNLNGNWEPFKLDNDATEYHKGIFQKDEKRVSVVAASAPQMGMVATSVLTNKIITSFRPKFIIMTGIAGGVKDAANFGDVLVTEISYDSGSGKIKTDDHDNSIFEPDYKPIELDVDVKELLLSCRTNRNYLDEIKRKWMGNKPLHELNIRIGPLASGAGVIQNQKIIDEIKGHSRKLIGIDMETYGVFYTAKNCSKPRPLSVMSFKSLSDFGDKHKSDDYQKYCAYTSANFAYHFILNELTSL
ncbi:MAG: hypothetical protein EOP48_00545 [Sphingobacteriales bacterium]|nr:MAG: hypothetical protein EOP48_00545 [Sphingobacteriales bacterium]